MVARELDTSTPDLVAEVEDGVLLITLNRPRRRNAVSDAMLAALGSVLAQGERDPEVGCVLLTGAKGAFSAGGDVKEFARAGAADQPVAGQQETIEARRRLQRATSGRLHDMPKPTIACVDGPAAGAGLGLALACDLRIASASSILLTAFARVGLSGDYGVTWLLTRLVGKAKALELLWFSDRLSASTALELGLVNRVVPDGEALGVARSLAGQLAHGPTVALHAIKDNVNRALASDLLTCMDLEVTEAERCAATSDHADAVRAFAAKQPPVFHGR